MWINAGGGWTDTNTYSTKHAACEECRSGGEERRSPDQRNGGGVRTRFNEDTGNASKVVIHIKGGDGGDEVVGEVTRRVVPVEFGVRLHASCRVEEVDGSMNE